MLDVRPCHDDANPPVPAELSDEAAEREAERLRLAIADDIALIRTRCIETCRSEDLLASLNALHEAAEAMRTHSSAAGRQLLTATATSFCKLLERTIGKGPDASLSPLLANAVAIHLQTLKALHGAPEAGEGSAMGSRLVHGLHAVVAKVSAQ